MKTDIVRLLWTFALAFRFRFLALENMVLRTVALKTVGTFHKFNYYSKHVDARIISQIKKFI